MSTWRLVFSRQAQKDAKKLASSGLKPKAQQLLDVIADDPFANPPRFEKLVGDLAGCYSRRINIQHRLVYEVHAEERIVHVLRMWTHYESNDGCARQSSSGLPSGPTSRMFACGSDPLQSRPSICVAPRRSCASM